MSRSARKPRAQAAPAPVEPRGAAHVSSPPLFRDPWLWATLAMVIPLSIRCAGASLGEPVAEDFDFLRRALFEGVGSLLDGGGSTSFWRPLAHQVYYATLGPLLISHPGLVAGLHVALLAAASVLVFRVLRGALGGPAAWCAASYPLLAESTRTLVSWPTQFVDVGLAFFVALALHETWRRRLPTALAALLLALLCKELAVVAALLLPWLPGDWTRRDRLRWAAGMATLTAVWAALYLFVRTRAHLALPHGIEEQAVASLGTKLAWAFGGSLRAHASLPIVRVPHDVLAVAIALLGVAVVVTAAATSRAVRERLRARRAWLAWGAGWFALASASLVPIHPLWQPNRAHFGATGAGVVAGVALAAVEPWWPLVFSGGRLVLLMLAPGAAHDVSRDPPESGAFMDFARLSRLQRFMSQSRRALTSACPDPRPGGSIMTGNMPHGLIYAFGGARAFQVWYRDSTLTATTYAKFDADSTQAVACYLQYQPRSREQVVVVGMPAMRAQLLAYRQLRADAPEAALASLARADSLAPEPRYEVFHANIAAYRALALVRLGRFAEAGPEAERALRMDDTDPNAWTATVNLRAVRGDRAGAIAAARELLRLQPGNASAKQWLERLQAQE